MTTVHVVPHTHWDREWYLPFQTFRMRLVDLVDRVLELADADPEFVFTLDGQLATADDYLEIRPEAESRIRSLVAAGRLAIGPWQTLMDEFLVSGEAIVRNLEAGIRRGEELGGTIAVGYLPDMFGHVAQMPQLLHRAGIGHAVVWRGVPAAVDRHAFRWLAPDGSAVRAEYLVGGYGNAAYLAAAPDRSAALATLAGTLRPFFGPDDLLALVGTDHMDPGPELVSIVRELNAAQDGYRLRLATLGDYFAGIDPEEPGLAEIHGELRSGARANLLMGVTSARIDLKAALARVERLLERYAEPLHALYGGAWPEPFLRLAWGRVLESSAHDSICGCSSDAVCDQVLVRLAEAEQVAKELLRRVAAAVAKGVPRGWTAVFNPSPQLRSGLVELEVAVPDEWEEVALELPDGSACATQEEAREDPLLFDEELPPAEVAERVFRRVHGRELFGHWLNGFRAGAGEIVFEVADEPEPAVLDVEELRREVEQAVAAAPDASWRVRVIAAPRRRIAAVVAASALGWTAVRCVRGPGQLEHPVEAEGTALANGLVAVRVEADGTLRISGGGVEVAAAARLVDGGDFGDSYNYAPPREDLLVEDPESVETALRAAGPVRGVLEIARAYRWPVGVRPDSSARRSETALVPVSTQVELRAGEAFVRLRVSLENVCSDHRLRLHVPLAFPARSSSAEGQFAVVERGLDAEGGHGEVPLPTFPARGFVDAGGVALLLDHPMEYELLEGRELAVTLLRSVGLISRNGNPWREEPAGPELAVPGAQLHGPWSVGLGLCPHAGSWLEAGVVEQAEHYAHGFPTAPGTADDAAPVARAGLEVQGEGVVLSALRRRGDWLELRLVCLRPEPADAVVVGGLREAREADLLGRPGGPLPLEDGVLRLRLGAWEIRTVQFRR